LDYGCMAPMVVFREVYEQKKVPITEEEARAPMGAHKRVHIRKIGEIPSVAERWKEVHGREQTEKDIDEMFEIFQPMQLGCLKDYSTLIPGTLETAAYCRKRGIKMGSTTGYTGEMMDVLLQEAVRQGYVPDCSVTATGHISKLAGDASEAKYSKSQVYIPEGRPAPWMCTLNALEMNVYPFHLCVKIDDTVPGIEEGANARMWTIGLAKSGNEIGKDEKEIVKMDRAELTKLLSGAYDRMYTAGADFVVDTIAEVPPVLDEIKWKLERNSKPKAYHTGSCRRFS